MDALDALYSDSPALTVAEVMAERERLRVEAEVAQQGSLLLRGAA